MKQKSIALFKTGFLYVFFLSANTFCIAREIWAGIAVFGFLISFLWTVNVRRVTASNIIDRIYYAAGAMTGGVSGVLITKYLSKLFILN